MYRGFKTSQAFIAIALIVALLAPAWPTAQASSSRLFAGMAAPQVAADLPDELANVQGATADWWAAVQEQAQQDLYALSEDMREGGTPSYTGHNAVHTFDLGFSPDGVHLTPSGAGPEAAEGGGWRWGLRLTGYGYEGRVQPLAAQAQLKAGGNQAEYRHAGVTEWYINDERGLEQGFVLDAAPPGGGVGQALVIEMALDTDLAPTLSDDGQRIDFAPAGGGAAVLRYADLYVADATGRELPAHLSLSPGRISIHIDDAGAAYPLLVDPVIVTPDWTTESDQAGAAFGTSVATAGDLNGDGYDDVVVGAPSYDGGTYTDNGRVSVYYGSAGGLPTTASWTGTGEIDDDLYGSSVSTAGDVNGDGYDDLIVGASEGQLGGKVYVYYGSATGLAADPDWSAYLFQNNTSFGTAVGTAGDVNGDGYDDIVVGAPNYDGGETGEGRAYVYHGSATGLPTTAHWTAESDDAYAYFGTSVGTAGDVNGDGYDDLIVGAPGYDNDQNSEGGAFVYFGSATGLSTAANWTAESNQVGSKFGASVGAAGDVNGDGYSDVVVGAPGFSYGQTTEGKAFIYHGSSSGLSTTANSTAEGDQVGSEFGTSVGTAGDVNRDGYDDLVVGAPNYDNGQTDEGRVFVYYGSPTGLPSIAQWTAESDQDGTFPETPPALGASVGTAGDVNGDGYDDVLAGAPGYDNGQDNEGRAYAFLGPVVVTTGYQWSAVGETATGEFGRSVATAGDLNGDGYSDIVVGAPYNRENGASAGKIYVYAGSALGLSLAPVWTALGEAAYDEFGRAVGAAGDLNGDGYDDLVAGAPGHGGAGKVYVYYGSPTGPGPGWTASGQYAMDEFGGAVDMAGDLNADGYDDLIVGASGYPSGNAYGKVYVYHGAAGGLGAIAAWTAGGQSAGDRFGWAVSTAGDVNADGYADVVVGAPRRSSQSGWAYGYHGGPGGLTPGAATWSAAGGAGDQFGYAVDTAGDVNGDGYADVIVGAPFADGGGADAGQALVYLGTVSGLPGTASWTVNGSAPGNRLGTSVATAGDVNGDGYADIVVGVYGKESLSGEIQVYRGSQNGLPSSPDRTSSGENTGDRLGLAVGAAGDVNGDGLSDVIAGAPGYDISGAANAGKAYVYHGAADAPDETVTWGRTGLTSDTAGDVNGDGYADVIVGSESAATAWVYYGSSAGLGSTADWTQTGTGDFGRTVGTAGDVNGDGYADVVVSGSSSVYLYLGSAAGLGSGAASWTASGSSVATAGDVNGDGYADVIAAESGTVHVYHGSAAGITPDGPAWSATGSGCFGCAVSSAGDVNADGYADVIVGAKEDDSSATDAGKAYLYLGSATGLATGPAVWTATGALANAGFGTDVSTAGDVNGDGYADVVVGAPYKVYSGPAKVYLFLGSPQGLDTPFLQLPAESSDFLFGTSVGTAGDVNGDGYADVIVGAPNTAYHAGKAYLYYGGSMGLTADWTIASDGSNLGVATAGDVNGDGFADLLINDLNLTTTYLHLGNNGGGRPALTRQTQGDGSQTPVQPWGSAYAPDRFEVSLHAVAPLGRAKARLQVQACPSGVPFGGASCHTYTTAGWTEIIEASGAELSEMASSLAEDTLYRWRARLVYDSPLYPHSPWRRLLGQGQEADVRVGMPATDLRITKTMTPTDELTPPAPIAYTLSFVAAGGPAWGVVITDILPASLENVEIISSGVTIYDTGVRPGYVWWVGNLETGEGGVITITAEASATRFVNTAIISSTSHDVNPNNNVAIVQTHVDGILYVDADAWGANDGSSWANAYTDLQDALADAAGGDEIWIAEGVYKPTSGTDRTATFSLASGVEIYGGFAGNEAYQHERDWRAHPTVLSGDIGTVGNGADNSYHVVSGSGVNSTAILDGVIIVGGRASGQDADGRGGGIYLSSAGPTLRSLALLGNTASQGGGLYITGGSPTVVNAVFSGNAAPAGGGLYNLSSSLALANATFSENSGAQGGAVYNEGTATLANCIVWDKDPNQSLIAGSGTTTVTYSDVRGGYGTGNLDADPQFMDAEGPDGIAGTLDDDLRLHTTFRFPSPVIDQGDNTALPVDAGDLDGDGDTAERLPLDVSARARLIGFTVVTPTVDIGAFEANIEDVLAEGDAMLAEGKSFRLERLQILPSDTLENALQNYSNFNDGEWYYAFCSDYANIDAYGYCPETGPNHVRNDLLDTVDLYRVAVSIWPAAEWTTRAGEVIPVWQRGGEGVVGAAVEIGNDHLIFGNEYMVDAVDYRFSTSGIPYADQIIAQELDELAQAARQFELVMDLIFRAFGEWGVGNYCTPDQFESFGVTSSLLMSALDEMATRHYMKGDSEAARDIYLSASRNQNMHLAALAKLAQETGHAYLINGSWEMLNNVSRMRERARQIEAGMDFFGFAPDYAPLQAYDQLLELTEGPTGNTGLLGTARDLEDQARDAQRTYDTNAADMTQELDEWRYELDEQLFELCGPTPDEDGDGYGDYKTCDGGLMAQNQNEYEAAYLRQALAWMHAQNVAREIQIQQEQTAQTIKVILAAGQEIAAADLAIGKLEANKTTMTTATSSESEFHAGGETRVEGWIEVGGKASTQASNCEVYITAAVKASVAGFFGGSYKIAQTDQTETVFDPAAATIGAYEGIKDLKEAEKEAIIEGANSAATIKNLLLSESEALEEWEIATAELNGIVIEHNNMMEKWSRLLNLYAQGTPLIMSYNSHLINPAYRLWRDSLTIQSSEAHGLAAQFAYLTARASEYELLTPFPNLGDVYKSRTANDLRIFLDELKVWHQALDLPGQLNRYPYTLSVAEDLLNLTDEQLDPQGALTPEELAQKRYEELQQQLASRMLDGELEIAFATFLEQQRPGGQYFFSQNIWNNRLAGIGEPLASSTGVKVNIVTTGAVNAGMVEVVLVHDGKASYRNASGQEVSYDPATAVPVGYLVPAELSPAYTTVVLRPDINGQGGEANGGLVNLSIAASRWKLRIPAASWGNLDVSQIEDIQISIDTTGRALSGRGAQAADDADRLAAGLAMQPPSKEWLQELAVMRQDPPDRRVGAGMGQVVDISAPIIPGVMGGPYFGNLVMTSPITIAVQQLDLNLWNDSGVLTGTVDSTETPFSPEPIGVSGTANGDQFILTSDVFTNVVNGRQVTQTFTLAGQAERDADVLRAVYTSTITNLLPEPIIVQGLFIASRPGVPAGSGLLVEAGAQWVPINTSTPVTVTLIDGTVQPITTTTTTEQITFTTDLGVVVPATADMVDGVALVSFVAGNEPGETVVFATTGVMTGQVRIEIMPNDSPVADAEADQTVAPAATVTLDGSGSSDPNGDALVYHWVQTGGTPVSFTPSLSITTFTAPTNVGQLTFALTVTDTGGLSDADVTLVTVSNLAPTANAGPDQTVDPGVAVTLDGSSSSDPNGGALAYHWMQTGGTPVGLTANVSVTTFIAPAGSGPLTFVLTVTDTTGLTGTDGTVITVRNLAPAANAGPDQTVNPGAMVTLNGSASSDPNGDALAYNWVQTGGLPISFLPNAIVTVLVAPLGAGPLTFALTVTDPGGLSHTDTVIVTVSEVAPVANAGPDQQVNPGATVTLDGRGSSDPNGGALVYYWMQTGGTPVSFTPGASVTTFTAPPGGAPLTFALTVTDTAGLAGTDSTVVTVRNLAPTANAGPDQTVDPGVTVVLDGSGSSDPNGGALVYYWVQTGGTPVTFAPNASITTFTAPAGAGQLTFALTVTDTGGLSDDDVTLITVRNVAPTANAGPDQQVDPGVTVTLDGRGSTDPNGDALAYHWTQTGGAPVSFSPNVSVTTFTAPLGAGPLTFALTVTDPRGLNNSDSAAVTVRNLAPTANAGADQQVDPGVTVTLDGSGSSDPNGDELAYHWIQTGGAPVSFPPNASVTTFTAPLGSGALTFILTVTDPSGLSGADSIAVTVRNLAPTANAGPDQAVDPGVTVTLDGRGSHDPNGDALVYHWTQTGGTPVSFSPNASVTTFTAPLGSGALTFALTVTDTAGLASTDSTVVTVGNLAPTANAGPDQIVNPGAPVTLDGSGSSDPNGDALTYHWVQTGGTPVSFSPDASITTFTAPAGAGQLTFSLTVTDTSGLAATDTALVTIANLDPVANAGADQQVDPGVTVTLDGSSSHDPNGDALVYHWVQTGGTPVSFSPAFSITTFTAPLGAGQLTFALTVTDTTGLPGTDSTAVTVRNLTPMADAGVDQQVDPGVTVTLDGRGSSDPNGDALAYHWVQTGGTPVSFSPNASVTTFTAPLGSGPLTFALTVTDTAGLASTDSTVVTVRNLAPTASAGPDQTVDPGVTVTLDGRGSSDPNGDALVYHWTQTNGTPVSFSPDASITTFTAPTGAGQLTFALTVTDTGGLVASDTTVITVCNLAPTANAGADQQVDPGVTVTLDGSSSGDPNGDVLTYLWTQTGGAPVSFSPALSVTTFAAPLGADQLTFALIVTNTPGMTGTDSTAITVRNLAPMADAGADQIVNPSVTVTLDGRGSSDPNEDALVYHWVQTGGAPVSFSPTLSLTAFTAPSSAGLLSFALTVTDTGGLATTDTTVVSVLKTRIYLPLITKNTVYPDLVIKSLVITSETVEVVFENQGSTFSPPNAAFYVDVYIAPSPAPTQVNQTWDDLCEQGIVWNIPGEDLPLEEGAVMTLTFSTDPRAPNLYYREDLSYFPGSLPEGTAVYAQVDSWNQATTYGAVLELHEKLNRPYNNIVGPVYSAPGSLHPEGEGAGAPLAEGAAAGL